LNNQNYNIINNKTSDNKLILKDISEQVNEVTTIVKNSNLENINELIDKFKI